MGRLRLVPLGVLGPDRHLLPWLANRLRRRLGVDIVLDDPLELHDAWFDPERGQFASNHVVDALVERDSPTGASLGREWVLAITRADLFADGRDFVFGEATQGGHWAVVSLARLRCPDPRLARSRLLKETLHELGHLAGLAHCGHHPRCVMRPSSDVPEVDRKSARFCRSCRAAVTRETLDRPSPPR